MRGRADHAERWERAVAHVASRAAVGPPLDPATPVTVHFHPDRLAGGEPILRRLATDGVWRSQFETGTSNGGLTAHPGGDRWRWEQRLFGGVYDDAPPSARPKYGALNHRARPAGGAVRFGSAHLRLVPEVLGRTTFCYPDSVFEPDHVGTAASLPLLALVEADDAAGTHDLLDDYVEAHVHGPLALAHVAALVLDPCFAGTEVESDALALGVPVEWHHGFRLHVDELMLHDDYRGPRVVTVGRSVARDGWLDARVVGDAVREGRHDPQDLKKVWHHVARWGHEPDAPAPPRPRAPAPPAPPAPPA
ncbi:DUF3626 domain-containing protein [Antribacter gilvus]|uniref:DUF3626 domain-containing protein n=1 Tax=Antribacter gilvus TaxID=2304675 RepID=UPI000F79AED8|nr:DUF3626 domain-containing protein [Antribacter gilvus]